MKSLIIGIAIIIISFLNNNFLKSQNTFESNNSEQLVLFEPSSSTSILPLFPDLKTTASDKTENIDPVEKFNKRIEIMFINPNFFYGIILDIIFVLLILLFVYYPTYKKSDTIFTFVLFNIIVYLLTYFLNGIKMSTGAAFGLFAIFSMLRYRTSSINMRDMTYLFVFIAMGLLSAIQLGIKDTLIVFSMIFVLIVILDSNLFIKREFYKMILYNNLELIHPDKREILVNEISSITGLKINRITVKKINIKNNTVELKAYYYE
ncbi:MAG: DUF4956 domain-containing protein [Saprospiraceae bacterium]